MLNVEDLSATVTPDRPGRYAIRVERGSLKKEVGVTAFIPRKTFQTIWRRSPAEPSWRLAATGSRLVSLGRVLHVLDSATGELLSSSTDQLPAPVEVAADGTLLAVAAAGCDTCCPECGAPPGVALYELDGAARPVLLSRAVQQPSVGVALRGNRLATVDMWPNARLRVFDVSDPALPRLEYCAAPYGSAVEFWSDERLLVGGWNVLDMFDIGAGAFDCTQPRSAQWSLHDVTHYPGKFDMAVDGRSVWIADSAGVTLVKLDEPEGPAVARVAEVDAPCVAVAGDILYVGQGGRGPSVDALEDLLAFDISDRNNIVPIATVPVDLRGWGHLEGEVFVGSSISTEGGNVYVAGGSIVALRLE